jgi:hypothetical protein
VVFRHDGDIMNGGDIGEAREVPEKEITKTPEPERRIDTYDDLRTTDSTGNVETYDDVRRSDNERRIDTYDDLRTSKEGGDKANTTDKTKASESRGLNAPEIAEQDRIDQAAESIRGQEWMTPEKWKTLSIDEKSIALEYGGKELGRAYNSPEPPLETKNMKNPAEQGEYGDGFSYDKTTDRIVGSDYGIKMNEDAVTQRNEKLFSDDPRAALETYSHEFWHSYQNEQAHAYEKGFRVDDPQKAKEWSENLKDYKQPPNAELARTDPEKYHKDYDAYRNQPIERDAREFGSRVISRAYGDTTES